MASPSGKLPELGYATWPWFKLDRAKANLSDDVRHALAESIGCHFDAGPAHTPDDRPYIERFFGSVAATLTGSFSWPLQPVGSGAFIALRAETLDACGFLGDSPPRPPPIDAIIGTEVSDLFSATPLSLNRSWSAAISSPATSITRVGYSRVRAGAPEALRSLRIAVTAHHIATVRKKSALIWSSYVVAAIPSCGSSYSSLINPGARSAASRELPSKKAS